MRDAVRIDLRRRQFRLLVHVIASVLRIGRVHSGRLDQRDRDRRPVKLIHLDAKHVFLASDVRDHIDRFPALLVDRIDNFRETLFAACREHELRTGPGGVLRGGESDAARRAGDHDDLLVEGFELWFHETLRRFGASIRSALSCNTRTAAVDSYDA